MSRRGMGMEFCFFFNMAVLMWDDDGDTIDE